MLSLSAKTSKEFNNVILASLSRYPSPTHKTHPGHDKGGTIQPKSNLQVNRAGFRRANGQYLRPLRTSRGRRKFTTTSPFYTKAAEQQLLTNGGAHSPAYLTSFYCISHDTVLLYVAVMLPTSFWDVRSAHVTFFTIVTIHCQDRHWVTMEHNYLRLGNSWVTRVRWFPPDTKQVIDNP